PRAARRREASSAPSSPTSTWISWISMSSKHSSQRTCGENEGGETRNTTGYRYEPIDRGNAGTWKEHGNWKSNTRPCPPKAPTTLAIGDYDTSAMRCSPKSRQNLGWFKL